jgi:cell division protein FtsB
MRRSLRLLHCCVLVFASGYCLFVAVAPVSLAQTKQVPYSDQERRVEALEAIRIDTEHRITKLESTMDAISLQSRGSMGGIGVLLIEAVLRLGRRRKDGSETA